MRLIVDSDHILNGVNKLVFVTVTGCVPFEVQTEFLNII
jgi:hypothetical protein